MTAELLRQPEDTVLTQQNEWDTLSPNDEKLYIDVSQGTLEERKVAMLARYGEFEPEVKDLQEELTDPASRESHGSLIGKGSNESAYVIEHFDGKQYVVRIANEGRGNGTNAARSYGVDSRVRGAVRAHGIPRLEQGVAASYEQGIFVSERMSGKNIADVTAEDLSYVTDEQLGDLIDNRMAAFAAGVRIDDKPSNYMYDRKDGFGIVDLAAEKAGDVINDIPLSIGVLASAIHNSGLYDLHGKAERAEDYEFAATQLRASQAVVARFYDICATRFEGGQLAQVQQAVAKKMAAIDVNIAEYSNPTWVARQVAFLERRAEEQTELAQESKQDSGSGWTFTA